MMLTQCLYLILYIFYAFFQEMLPFLKAVSWQWTYKVWNNFHLLNLEAKAQFYSGKKEKKKKNGVGFRPPYTEQFCILCRGTP